MAVGLLSPAYRFDAMLYSNLGPKIHDKQVLR